MPQEKMICVYDMISFLCMLEGSRLVLPVHNGRYHHVMTVYIDVHGTDVSDGDDKLRDALRIGTGTCGRQPSAE